MSCKLFLIIPTDIDVRLVRETAERLKPAAVLLSADHKDMRELVAPLQALDVAVLLPDRADLVADLGADGIHLGGAKPPIPAVRRALGEGSIIGATAQDRHHAMLNGEAGADYIFFGEPAPGNTSADQDLIAWWAETMTLPSVAYAATLEEARLLARAGADFVALGDAIWCARQGAATAAGEARKLLSDF